MGRVLVDLCDGRGAVPAAEAQVRAPGLRDMSYFAEVAETAGTVATGVERFVISYSSAIDRSLTQRDVWFLVGDETSMPVPWQPPCPVFRTHGDRYITPNRGIADLRVTAAEVLLRARNAVLASRVMWPRPFARSVSDGWLPLGHPGIDRAPDVVPPLGERQFDLGFRGSLGGGRAWSPRTVTRQRMKAGLDALPPGLAVDLLSTASFVESFSRTGNDYADALLDTRIALIPRGGSLETYRGFEAAMCGCVLVTEPLPSAWYYSGLPRAEVRAWSQLPTVVAGLLRDPEQMQVMADGARRWALEVVSAPAIGRWVGRILQEHAAAAA